MTTRYIKLEPDALAMGIPLPFSIYNKTGDLLLRKGRVITTSRQLTLLLELGYVDQAIGNPAKLRHSANAKGVQVLEDDVFILIGQWLSTLSKIFNFAGDEQRLDFGYQVLQLALQIQLQCRRDSEALHAALQMDEDNHYGLVHALHCAVICETLAKLAGITQTQRLSIVAGALTHDFGIIKLQEELHRQPGKPTEEQWQQIKNHPVISEAMLYQHDIDDPVWLDIARHHHERLDGSGYPDGLSGKQLSLPVRIMAVADTYTAITRTTVFRPQSSANSAIKVLFEERENSLDAKLVERFIKTMGIYPLGSLVRLANKEVAVVVKQQASLRQPLVASLLAGDGSCFVKPRYRETDQDEFAVSGVEPIGKFKLLQRPMEQLWVPHV